MSIAARLAEWRAALHHRFFDHLQEQTQIRYAAQLQRFDTWCGVMCPEWGALSHEDRDTVLAHYVAEELDDSTDLSSAKMNDLVAALQRRCLYQRYRQAWGVLELYRRDNPPEQALPFTVESTWAFATVAFALGWLEEGLVALLAFHGLLRISEALELAFEDLVLPIDDVSGVAVVMLRRSKRGFDERVPIHSHAFVQVWRFYMNWQCKRGVMSGRLFTLQYWRFRKRFLTIVAVLRLPPGRWLSHSFRRGGATHLVECRVPWDEVRNRGRWASERSCREYIRRGANAVTRLRQQQQPGASERIRQLSMVTFAMLRFACSQHADDPIGTWSRGMHSACESV